jgi:hypothetical protein
MSRLTGFQRFVLGVTGLLAALRLFFPVKCFTRTCYGIDVGATLLQVLALALLAAVVMFEGQAIWKAVWVSLRRHRVVVLVAGLLIVLSWLLISLK